MTFHPDTLPTLNGKVFIVTGGNSGIGYYTVAHLARCGAHVYMCARSEEKASKAIGEIQTAHPQARISFLRMDHLDLGSVAAAADEFLAKEGALHGLVNNAGIMATPFQLTKDGYEAQWQTNYLAHWLLTTRLTPLLLRTSRALPAGSVRVVNLTSSGHWSAPRGGIHWADTSLARGSSMTRYGQSKLANVLHTRALHAAHGPGSAAARAGDGEIWSASVHPGLVGTNLASHATEIPAWMLWIVQATGIYGFELPPNEGAFTSLYAAASPDMTAAESGAYFQRVAARGWQSCSARDVKLALRLDAWATAEMRRGGWVE
ncbi:NAD(P)-binding protein [Xylariomycetidae sp. FL2044]|nr:NAD(P)-binding protein [Xylariomycetidae sp. FL2044]